MPNLEQGFRADHTVRPLPDGRWSIAVLRIGANNVAEPFEVFVSTEAVQHIEKALLDEAREIVKPNVQLWVGTSNTILRWKLPVLVEQWCAQLDQSRITAATKFLSDSPEISLADVRTFWPK
jgi:hypothetical protein